MKWTIKNFEALSKRELYEILKFRTEVFVVGQNCLCVEPDGKDYSAWHLWLEDKEQILAYARIFAPGDYDGKHASIGRVAVREDFRGRGLGKEVMKKSLDFIRKKSGEVPVKISAQAYLVDFYKHLGFVPASEIYLEENMPHLAMIYSPGREE